jgi:hypothetical protein
MMDEDRLQAEYEDEDEDDSTDSELDDETDVEKNFREVRDRFLVPDLENLLQIRTATTGELADEAYVGYRPKDGDNKNLALLLPEIDYYQEMMDPYPIIIWLPNNDGFCVVDDKVFQWTDVEIVWKETVYSAAFDAQTGRFQETNCSLYLSNAPGDDCPAANCDCVLETIAGLAISIRGQHTQDRNVNDSQLVLEGSRGSSIGLDNCFSLSAWQRCVEALAKKNVPISLDAVSLSDEQWTVLEHAQDLIVVSKIPMPCRFWSKSRCSEVHYWNAQHDSLEVTVPALAAMGTRTKP